MYTPTKQYLKKIKRIKNRLLNGEYILGEMKWSFDVYDVYECSGISPFILGTWMSTKSYSKCFCFYWDLDLEHIEKNAEISCCDEHDVFSHTRKQFPNKNLNVKFQNKNQTTKNVDFEIRKKQLENLFNNSKENGDW